MKTSTKVILAGTGIAAVGLLAYGFLKRPDIEVPDVSAKGGGSAQAGAGAARISTPKWIEHRKKRIAEMREARKAAQRPSAAYPASGSAGAEETQRPAAAAEPELAVDMPSAEKVCAAETPTQSE